MRTIVNYFRSMFCNHKFIYEETWYRKLDYHHEPVKQGNKVSRTCTKCGWHKSYWKY
jgi:RNase P subunit RPR2